MGAGLFRSLRILFANPEDRKLGEPCITFGLPRLPGPCPFRIIQSTDKIQMVYEYAAASRTIDLDRRPRRAR